MGKTAVNHAELLSSLAGLHQLFSNNQDIERSGKLKQLIRKVNAKEVQLAFCGHFSAGKSSMINYLMGQDVLPSSPVPTSANIVKLKKGKDAVKVIFFDGTYAIFEGKHDMKEIKKYCKEGDIKEIHISSEDFPLSEDCAVLDTPGIDSTDDAHRISTESMLHLADIVFYVMDYNHVQSEENFLFAKKMQEAGKKLYLLVNQIDKHDESELSFSAFKQSVVDSFGQWEIEPEEIFYTSLRDSGVQGNQAGQVQTFIHEQIKNERAGIPDSARSAAMQLAEEHLLFLQEEQAEAYTEAKEILEQLTDSEKKAVRSAVSELKKEKETEEAFPERFRIQLLKDLDELLKNAYLLTADSRELIKDFLEAQQPGFKVGLLFAKNKTEAARKERENKLMEELRERTKTQLDWHLREFANKSIKNAGIRSSSIESEAQQMTADFGLEEIKELLVKQIDVNGDYVLLFSGKVSDLLKRKGKTRMIAFASLLKQEIEKEKKKQIQAINKELEKLSKYERALNFLEELEASRTSVQKQVKRILDGQAGIQEKLMEDLLRVMEDEEQRNKVDISPIADKEETQEKRRNSQSPAVEAALNKSDSNIHMLNWSRKLKQASASLVDVQGFGRMAAELLDKASRLENRTYTIALFGAFSAGKSSFANALFGEKVLPVSPNPTTAVINKIKAPDAEHEHKTATIKIKTAEMMLEDLKIASEALGFSPKTLEEVLEIGNNTQGISASAEGKGKAHLSFITAFTKGYPLLKERLGATFTADYDVYKSFAAEEAKSCFVEEITLHFACDLTRQGIVLVDTPGADSINARHTNAAFHYIKNSDAILFVTYYNHPFAKADREFLIQLGRVKDAFSMDKMFFICNAVDLARTEDELSDVMDYITSQLEGFGIRFPRLFGVSSKEALREKNGKAFRHDFLETSGIQAFEKAFDHFIQHELMDMACAQAETALERAYLQMKDLSAAANASAEEKHRRLEMLKEEYGQLKDALKEADFSNELAIFSKEADELLYYIKQRVFLRYGDFFKESFNPSVIKEDGRDMRKALRGALMELLQSIGFDFSQEMRALSVRLEKILIRLLNDKQENFRSLIVEKWSSVQTGTVSIGTYEVPDFGPAFEELTAADFKKELAIFKSPKAFFERNEKKKMADALQDSLQKPTDEYLAKEGSKAKLYYSNIAEQEYRKLADDVLLQLEEAFNGYRSVLEMGQQKELYEEKETMLASLLEKKDM